MKPRILYELSSDKFLLPLFFNPSNNKPHLIRANNIPMICWPDGQWCMEANLYMLRLYKDNYSRKYRGGSILIYATYITHIIRYCYNSSISLFDITDSHFTMFMNSLRLEKDLNTNLCKTRSNSQTIRIGRRCLDFLKFLSAISADTNYISEGGRINVTTRISVGKHSQVRRTDTNYITEYLHHSSFPRPDSVNRRTPISDHATSALRAAVATSTNNSFIKARRYLMLRMLDSLGGRRVELVNLDLHDVELAIRDQQNMISLVTVKRGEDKQARRMIPITSEDLKLIEQYTRINRSPVIKRTCGKNNDQGALFISDKSGLRLTANTITSEVQLLRKQAGLAEPASPHLYRHRYITKIFVFYLEHFKTDSTNSFSSLGRYIQTIKAKIMQLTGHRNSSSLDHYINLAFEEAVFFELVRDKLLAAKTLDNFRIEVQRLRIELIKGLNPEEATAQAISIFEEASASLIDV